MAPVLESEIRKIYIDVAVEGEVRTGIFMAFIEAHPVEQDHLAPYLARWHFTATQRHQLEEQVRRWSLCAAGPPWPAGIESLTSATAVIRRLAELCDQRALPLR